MTTLPINPGTYTNLAQKWHKIANALGVMYGDTYKDKEILVVRIGVRQCFVGVCATEFVPMLKPCNKTMKEAAQAISDRIDDKITGGGGLNPGGPAGPTPNTSQMCFTNWYRLLMAN